MIIHFGEELWGGWNKKYELGQDGVGKAFLDFQKKLKNNYWNFIMYLIK